MQLSVSVHFLGWRERWIRMGKNHDAVLKECSASLKQECKHCHMFAFYRYVVIACDGLWKCFEPKDSIKFISDILEVGSYIVYEVSYE